MKISSRITAAAAVGIALAAVLPLTASAASSPGAALPVRCAVHSPAGNCYKPGEFCPHADANMTAAGHVTAGYDVITCELKAGRWRWTDRQMSATAYAVPCVESGGKVMPAAGAAAGQVIACTATVKALKPASLGDQLVLTAPDGKHGFYNLRPA